MSMYTIFDPYYKSAPMDTDGRSSAWFDPPYAGPSYFPAFITGAYAGGNSFTFETPDAFSDSTVFNNHNMNIPATTNDAYCAVSNTNTLNRPTLPAPMYKMYLKEIMRGKGSSKAKFRCEHGVEHTVKNGSTVSVSFRQQHITAMHEYKDQSFEEIRLEDYIRFSAQDIEENTDLSTPAKDPVQKKPTVPEPSHCSKPIEILSQPSLLNTLLQNVTKQKDMKAEETNNEPSTATAAFNATTLSILQALMNNVKQHFDVNYLSEEAKRSCAALTHALAEYTEKTIENLTVIVLEDILRNIKRREVVSPPATADKYTSTCLCSEKNSPPREEIRAERTKTKNTMRSTKRASRMSEKYEDDCSSECQDLRSVRNEREHRCELADKESKSGRKKAASVPATLGKTLAWATRSARHSYNGSGRSVDKAVRHKSQHRKFLDEKYRSSWEKTAYDDSDNDECGNRNESKYSSANKEDGWVTITKAKHNRESCRRKKKSPKKLEIVMHDECRMCESLGRVSLNDCNRKEYVASKEKNTFPRCKERVYEAAGECADEKILDERQLVDKSLGAPSANVDKCGAGQNESELQSYSDSSSI